MEYLKKIVGKLNLRI